MTARTTTRLTRWLMVWLLLQTSSAATVLALPPASATTPHVQASLLASAGAVRPGDELLLGLHQDIIPHWHTYWKNPGDSGAATRIDWQLPAGTVAGDLLWPAPRRFAIGPVTNYGYENSVTLLTPVQVPVDAQPGTDFTVQASVSWLVCREECIPEDVELALSLPVVPAGADVPPGSDRIGAALAQLPVALPGPVQATGGAEHLQLQVQDIDTNGLVSAWFYADEWGRVEHSAEQTFAANASRLTLQVPVGEVPSTSGAAVTGVLVLDYASATGQPLSRSYEFSAVYSSAPAAPFSGHDQTAPALWLALLLAFAGGLILNLMPCVFPVLSIKALFLLRHADHSARQHRLQGLAYTAGVLGSFTLLAVVLLILRAAGEAIGWGFQFQSPVFVVLLAYLMFVIGLNLSGVFVFGSSVAGVGSSLVSGEGYRSSFFTGVLAAVVATPCTAPFMGVAIGYAVSQPAPVLLAVFLALGLGLALPYLLLASWPRLQRRLPKPGVWMERLKELLAFPMYATAVWLVWVLAQQGGADAVALALTGMLLLALAAWLYQHRQHSTAGWKTLAGWLVVILIAGALWLGGRVVPDSADAVATPQPDAAWQPYSAATLAQLRAGGQPVFVNMTAAWCITCLANERVALSDNRLLQDFRDRGITYLKGDWTNQDPAISAYLASYGRSGVPLYVYYPPQQGQPVVLPQLLTAQIVRDVLQ